MSEIIQTISGREHAHIVQTEDGKYYYIDTAKLAAPLVGKECYETAVFAYDKERDEVKTWEELYLQRFYDRYDLAPIHNYICYHLEEFIIEGRSVG